MESERSERTGLARHPGRDPIVDRMISSNVPTFALPRHITGPIHVPGRDSTPRCLTLSGGRQLGSG